MKNTLSKINDNIKKRKNPKDVFITPLQLAKFAIDMIENKNNFVWLDNCKNNGSIIINFLKIIGKNIVKF